MTHPIGSIAYYADSLTRTHDSLTRQLTRWYADKDHTLVVAREDRRLTEATYTALWGCDDSHRVYIWALDSMLWTIEEFKLGNYTHAFRGYIQACGYFGKLGRTPDEMIALRNAMEAVTEYVVGRESYCRCGVTRHECHSDTIGSHDLRMRDLGNAEGA